MTIAGDKQRMKQKQKAVLAKLEFMTAGGRQNTELVVSILDEWKLDLILLALGDGEVLVRYP